MLIVVDVSQPLAPAESVTSRPQILLQMVSGLMRDHTQASLETLHSSDVLLRPQLGSLTSAGFMQMKAGVQPGVAAANASLEQLRKLAIGEQQYVAWQDHQRHRPIQDPTISFVRVASSESRTSRYVRDRISAKAHEPLDVDQLERDITQAYGRGTYDSIGYRLAQNAGDNTGLEVTPLDTELGRTLFRLGLQVNDDFTGHDDYQFDIEGRVTGLNSKGAEWRTFVGVGRIGGASSDVYLPFGSRGAWFVDPSLSYTATNQPLTFEDRDVADYRVSSSLADVRIGRDLTDKLRVSASLLRGADNGKLLVGDLRLPSRVHADLGGVGMAALWDSLDNVRFPLSGVRAELSYSEYSTRLGSSNNGNLLRFSFDAPLTYGANTLMFGMRASLEPHNVDAYQTESTLGGLFFLSGLNERQLLGDNDLLFRAIYYRRLNPARSLLRLPLYLGTSLEGGNVWENYDDVSLHDLIGAASVFFGIDLPIGALQLD